MKKTTCIFYMIIFFALTGCTVDYNLKMDKNMMIEETVRVSETNSYISTFALRKEDFINDTIKTYSSSKEYVDYEYSSSFGSQYSGAIATKKFLDIYDYKNKNVLYKDFFSNIVITEEGKLIKLKFISNTTNELLSTDSIDLATINYANIYITLPFKVVSSNADIVDSENNTYIWKYSEDNYIKDIEISFNKGIEFRKELSVEVYILIGILGIFVLLGIYIYYKNRKSNKL